MIVDGVVLAGGGSRRMGHDKAVIEVAGRRLVDRAVVTLSRLGGEVVVAAGNRTIAGLTARQVTDRVPGAGPLAGIEAGLAAISSDLGAVLAVDAVAPSDGLFRALAEVWDGSSLAVVPSVRGVQQPLHACWSASALPVVSAALDRGERSPTRLLAASAVQLVGPDLWGRHDPDAAFARSYNLPGDLPG